MWPEYRCCYNSKRTVSSSIAKTNSSHNRVRKTPASYRAVDANDLEAPERIEVPRQSAAEVAFETERLRQRAVVEAGIPEAPSRRAVAGFAEWLKVRAAFFRAQRNLQEVTTLAKATQLKHFIAGWRRIRDKMRARRRAAIDEGLNEWRSTAKNTRGSRRYAIEEATEELRLSRLANRKFPDPPKPSVERAMFAVKRRRKAVHDAKRYASTKQSKEKSPFLRNLADALVMRQEVALANLVRSIAPDTARTTGEQLYFLMESGLHIQVRTKLYPHLSVSRQGEGALRSALQSLYSALGSAGEDRPMTRKAAKERKTRDSEISVRLLRAGIEWNPGPGAMAPWPAGVPASRWAILASLAALFVRWCNPLLRPGWMVASLARDYQQVMLEHYPVLGRLAKFAAAVGSDVFAVASDDLRAVSRLASQALIGARSARVCCHAAATLGGVVALLAYYLCIYRMTRVWRLRPAGRVYDLVTANPTENDAVFAGRVLIEDLPSGGQVYHVRRYELTDGSHTSDMGVLEFFWRSGLGQIRRVYDFTIRPNALVEQHAPKHVADRDGQARKICRAELTTWHNGPVGYFRLQNWSDACAFDVTLASEVAALMEREPTRTYEVYRAKVIRVASCRPSVAALLTEQTVQMLTLLQSTDRLDHLNGQGQRPPCGSGATLYVSMYWCLLILTHLCF